MFAIENETAFLSEAMYILIPMIPLSENLHICLNTTIHVLDVISLGRERSAGIPKSKI